MDRWTKSSPRTLGRRPPERRPPERRPPERGTPERRPQATQMEVRDDRDISVVRRLVAESARTNGLSEHSRTRLVTATSELTRNLLSYGGGGWVRVSDLLREDRIGVEVVFEDQGPGIQDLERAMDDGFSTGQGLGLGLGGAKRLVDSFDLQTQVGRGTVIKICNWRAPSTTR